MKFEGLGLEETIQVIHASGGFAVLAHPTRYDLSATNIRYLIEILPNLVEMPSSCRRRLIQVLPGRWWTG